MNLGGGLNRPRASETDPPLFLQWTTPPLPHDLDLIGPIELQLDVTCTAPDTAFIAVLQDVDEDANTIDRYSGLSPRRLAGSRRGGEQAREPLSFRAEASKQFRSARRSATGFRSYPTPDAFGPVTNSGCISLRTIKTRTPALLEFRHASIGTSSLNAVFSSSRLLLPVLR